MTLEEIRIRLESVLNPKRFKHSINVMNEAVELAGVYGENTEKAALAGLLHDCARGMKGEEIFSACEKYSILPDNVSKAQPELLHGVIGTELAREDYGITDRTVLNAIRYHTTGRENMELLEKIIFVADYIEPGRDFPGVREAREIAFTDIDRAVLLALNRTIEYVLIKGALIHIDTIFARNFMINSMKMQDRPDGDIKVRPVAISKKGLL